MINQDTLEEIVQQELKAFNESLGWIDPDTVEIIDDYDKWEKVVDKNDNIDCFEISDLMITRIKGDSCLGSISLNHYEGVILFVGEHEPYEDWVNFSHEFRLPNLSCLDSTESFTEAFKKALAATYTEMRLKAVRDKIRLPHMEEDKVLEMEGAEYVDFRFYMNSWDYEILDIKK